MTCVSTHRISRVLQQHSATYSNSVNCLSSYSAVHGFWPVEFLNGRLGAIRWWSDSVKFALVLHPAPVTTADLVTLKLQANEHPSLAPKPFQQARLPAPLTPSPTKNRALYYRIKLQNEILDIPKSKVKPLTVLNSYEFWRFSQSCCWIFKSSGYCAVSIGTATFWGFVGPAYSVLISFELPDSKTGKTIIFRNVTICLPAE
jgi:hypothetical protein